MSGSSSDGDQGRDQTLYPSGEGQTDTSSLYPLNAALPAGARWVVAPTLQNLQQGRWPSMESIDPTLYQGNSQYTDPASGGRISVVPWQVNPAYDPGSNPLIVSPAIPFGGTEDLKGGTYADPSDPGGPGTYFNYDLGTGYATPTQQSLQIQLQNELTNRMGPAMSLFTELPFMATAAFAAQALPAMLAPLAGGLAAATTTAGSGLLGDVLGAVNTVKPVLGAAQDVMKVASLLDQPRPQVGR